MKLYNEIFSISAYRVRRKFYTESNLLIFERNNSEISYLKIQKNKVLTQVISDIFSSERLLDSSMWAG